MRWGECHAQSHICAHTRSYTHPHPHNSDIYITLAPSSSDAGTLSLPSMSPSSLFSPSFFQVIPLVTSVLLISPCFSSPHFSLCPTTTHVLSLSPSLKAPAQHHFDSKKKKKKKKKKKTKKGKVMGRKMKWLSGPSRKSMARSSRQAIFPQLLPLTEPSSPVDEVLIPGIQ